MLGRTHAAIGTFTAFVLTRPAATVDYVVVIGFAYLGSLIPDIDTKNSKIKHSFSFWIIFIGLFLYLDKIIELLILAFVILVSSKFKHRTFTHSILGLLVFSMAIGLLYPNGLLVFAIDYLMHLLSDSLTIHGVPYLYPFSNKCYGSKLIKTGSSTDKGIGRIFILLLVILIFEHF